MAGGKKRSSILFAILGPLCFPVAFYWMWVVGKEVNAAHGKRRVNALLPWIALGLYLGALILATVLAQEIDLSLARYRHLGEVALLILLAAYFVGLAVAVKDLKTRRDADSEASALRMQIEIVLLLCCPPVGIYLVQEDLNRCWEPGERARAAPG